MTTMTWQLQEAKNKFSQLVNQALLEGPQIVTRHGKRTVVVIPYAQFEAMGKTQTPSLASVLLNAPQMDEVLDLTRDRSLAREIEL